MSNLPAEQRADPRGDLEGWEQADAAYKRAKAEFEVANTAFVKAQEARDAAWRKVCRAIIHGE